ncbi:MAG: gamma-glutamyltransferase [Bacteriovoracaceae bacterium]|jgi:gamma-glutamyltranspeptidase/glutathione hydrolase|nr:gamma-glutamyltransferase [Bacteriovoracaceae bacterium]
MTKIVLILLVGFNAYALRTAPLIKGKQRSTYEAIGKKYMISSQGGYTTMAAKFAFDKGGNIYDAFVAASFVISVERPHSTGIGGGGFLISHEAAKRSTYTYDFRESAPLKSHSKMFLDKNGKQINDKSITGALAVGTPGLVAGLYDIHKKHGKLPWSILLTPAIKLANLGFPIYPALYKAIDAEKKRLCKYKDSKRIFLNDDCSAKKEGEVLVQKDLGTTLRMIAAKGKNGFYKGHVAKMIVKSQKELGGLITQKDLDVYKVKMRNPVVGEYKGYKIISMPPPSSGGTHIIQILNILKNFDLKKHGPQSARAIHYTSTAMQIAFADRAKYMGDSDFAKVPVNELIHPKYAKAIAKKISSNKAMSSKSFPQNFRKLIYESDDTTHFTIMDIKGNIVTSTQTINGWFGSAVVAPKTGVVLNNEMDDFASHVGGVNLFGAVGGQNNLVQPLKRPLSSMSPTIVFKNEKPFMALGTPSGTRILTCVMQTVLNVLEYDMDLWDAVSATRYHHQWSPDEIRVGPPYFEKSVEEELKKMGHKIKHKSLGCKIQAIMKKNEKLIGVSDPREEGMSFGI